jgi:tRNA(fMet)-specific endonuclease VapC
VILDTDFVIDVLDDQPDAAKKAAALDAREEVQYLSLVTVYELFQSVGAAQHPDALAGTFDAIIEERPLLGLDGRTMRTAGRVWGQLRVSGDEIGALDTMIGASGLVHDESVLTGNVEHFERIPDLSIETYEKN